MARNSLSSKGKYYLPKYRRLELNNYCRQYSSWKRNLRDILLLPSKETHVRSAPSSPVEKAFDARSYYVLNINLVEKTCKEVAGDNWEVLLLGVTEGYSYDILEARLGILRLSRTAYYEKQRQFFFILDSHKKHLFY